MTTSPSTCDLCDAHESEIGKSLFVLHPLFKTYGADRAFHGAVHTIRAYDGDTLDNSRVREAVSEPGLGRVLVIDGAGLVTRALLGGNLAVNAAKNGWAGVVIHGAARDAAELREANLPVRALALCPMRTAKQGLGERGIELTLPGATVREGDWLYADEDGIVVHRRPLG
jgi:regulator of ribonuclease activity A